MMAESKEFRNGARHAAKCKMLTSPICLGNAYGVRCDRSTPTTFYHSSEIISINGKLMKFLFVVRVQRSTFTQSFSPSVFSPLFGCVCEFSVFVCLGTRQKAAWHSTHGMSFAVCCSLFRFFYIYAMSLRRNAKNALCVVHVVAVYSTKRCYFRLYPNKENKNVHIFL